MAVAEQEIKQAKALARDGNSQAAIALLSKLIQRDANNLEAWLALADVVDDPERAEFCLQKVLNLDPGNATAQGKLALLKGGSLSVGSVSPGMDNSIEGAAGVAQLDQAAGDDLDGAPADEAAPSLRIEDQLDPKSAEEDRLAPAPVVPPASTDEPKQRSAAPSPEIPAQTLQAKATGPQLKATVNEAPDRIAKPEVAPTAQDELSKSIKKRSPFGRTDLILVGLTLLAGIVLCGLVGAAVVGGSSLFSKQPAEDPDAVVQVVFDNIIAANREDLAAYMGTIHPDSPGYNTTQVSIASAFSIYDLSYEIFIPEMLEQSSSEAVISFVLTTRRKSGPAFRDNTVTGEMTLRKSEGEWRIYNQTVNDVQYLN